MYFQISRTFNEKKLLNFKGFFEEMDRGPKPESGYVFFFLILNDINDFRAEIRSWISA